MAKRKLVSIRIASDLVPIEPALDFFNGVAIVSVKEKAIVEYQIGKEEDEIEERHEERAYSVLSTGHRFFCTHSTLAQEGLFYSGCLDLPLNRWRYEDICEFCENGQQAAPDIHNIFRTVREKFAYYMDFEDDRYHDILSCFVIYTYFYPLFPNAPLLHLWGEFQSGKTKIVSLLTAMAFNPVNSSNISSASVFRLVQGRRAIVLLDESEDLMGSEKGKEIRNMLLAGTGKSGEAYRQEKMFDDTYKTASYKVFSPKVIANITGVDLAPLQSRTIRLTTTGAQDKMKANRYPDLDNPEWQPIRSALYRLCLTRFKELEEQRENVPEIGLSGRQLGSWLGILTIAHWLQDEVWDSVLAFAKENTAELKAELGVENPARMLMGQIIGLVHEEGSKFYSNDSLYNKVWRDKDGNILVESKQAMGRTLHRLGFKSSIHRIGDRTERGYFLDLHTLIQRAKRF